MAAPLRFDDRVAIVTGAGGGLGRAYALFLASRGARVVVNDLGGSVAGSGSDRRAAERVVDEIVAAGGQAVANADSVTDGAAIVAAAIAEYGRVDILVANAGILRDASFANMDDAAWDAVVAVHLTGAERCAKAAWAHMRAARYGRVVFVTSGSGLYGNFGQANYGAAKLGVVGLANTLAKEGEARGIRVNAVAPIAASRMTEALLPPDMLAALRPEAVTPLVALLAHEECPTNGGVFEAGAGWVARLRWQRGGGAWLGTDPAGWTPETLAARWGEVEDWADGRASFPETNAAAFEAIARLKEGSGGGAAVAAAASAPVTATAAAATAPWAAVTRLLPQLADGATGVSGSVDAAAAVAHVFSPVALEYTERDAALYALAVGACTPSNGGGDELQYVYEGHPDGEAKACNSRGRHRARRRVSSWHFPPGRSAL